MGRIDFRQLEKARAELGEATLDPRRWPTVMEAICAAVATTGAALLQSDIRTPDVPTTPSVAELFKGYFESSLHTIDVRAARGVPLLLAGRTVLRDQDIFASESEMLRDPLYAHLTRYRFRWFSAVSFYSGSALWVLSFQRLIKQGMYADDELSALASLSSSLTEVATLSQAMGRRIVLGVVDAFEQINEPALAIMRGGIVLRANASAIALFDDDFRIRSDRLYIRDATAGRALDDIILACALRDEALGSARASDATRVVVRRTTKRPIVAEILPVPAAARSPFWGASIILRLKDLETTRRSPAALLSALFSLTPAEAKVASMLREGFSPDEIADLLEVSRATVRNQVKAILGKTATHRQSELVALLARL